MLFLDPSLVCPHLHLPWSSNSLQVSSQRKWWPVALYSSRVFLNPLLIKLDLLILDGSTTWSLYSISMLKGMRNIGLNTWVTLPLLQPAGIQSAVLRHIQMMLYIVSYQGMCLLQIQVHAAPNRYHSSYLGASALALMQAFDDACISANEWRQNGANILKKWKAY